MHKLAPTSTSEQVALDAAIHKAGGKTALMRLLNARGYAIGSHNVITQWRITRIPAHYCPDIEELTAIPCEELRADVRWRVLRNTAAKVRARLRAIRAESASKA